VLEPEQTVARAAPATAQGATPPTQTTPVSAGPARPPPPGFVEFYQAHYRDLVKAAMYMGATFPQAEDAVQKTLEEMLGRWPVDDEPLAYARMATAHNFIKEKTRGPQRVARRLAEKGHVAHQEGAVDRGLTVWEDSQWVDQVLDGLPPAQREVMECVVRDIDPGEIAAVLGKTKEAVRRNLCDARGRLRRELNPDGTPKQPAPNKASAPRKED
jgi:RNA polymerase sigma factor (sigma-70 family)